MSLKIDLLEQSFESVKQREAEFTTQFYANLFSDYPIVKPLFANTHMEEQGKKLFASLVLVVDALRKPEVLENALKGLGTRHVQYGVLPQHYPMVGGALLKTFEALLGSDWTPELKQAWIDAYGSVTQLMLEGADYPSEILKPVET
ncbi:MAG: flavohemoprotein [Hydrococcus sp. C42_A2020_068]|uniref:globin family protein n=1 Tax=Pleurocapsa sp. PCC 7327 TaxID=118163 RepID=UPI00029FB6AB|nr:globin family protein [Pleurocapsa sp. PCC 7327]AFY78930.1 hemoglobin-like flavoprotein [Pleurocapsa sp. PCC 7327]MBF2019849.1 flavohemoprotein [Hydrococcus sp. C42_A2020_068]